jgi:hypothetical protein
VKHALLLVNIVLLVAGVLLTQKFLSFRDTFNDGPRVVLPEAPPDPALAEAPGSLAAQAGPLPLSHRRVIHSNNLFHPDRRWSPVFLEPDLVVVTEPETEDELEATFDLISIANWNGIRLANIAATQNTKPASRSRIPSKVAALKSRIRSSRAPSRSKAKDNGRGKIYKLGDYVKGTRFRVVEIGFGHVKLKKKGEDPLILSLNRGDEASSQRYARAGKDAKTRADAAKRDAAKAAALARPKTTKPKTVPKKEPAKVKSTPPPPPPPPPPPVPAPAAGSKLTPASPTSGSGTRMSRSVPSLKR